MYRSLSVRLISSVDPWLGFSLIFHILWANIIKSSRTVKWFCVFCVVMATNVYRGCIWKWWNQYVTNVASRLLLILSSSYKCIVVESTSLAAFECVLAPYVEGKHIGQQQQHLLFHYRRFFLDGSFFYVMEERESYSGFAANLLTHKKGKNERLIHVLLTLLLYIVTVLYAAFFLSFQRYTCIRWWHSQEHV